MQVLVLDGFSPDPQREREAALSAEYKTIEHNELSYRGISFTEDKDSISNIESIIGQEFNSHETFYRRYLTGEKNETYIHSDVLIGTYTGILFLNHEEEYQGGTAFWRHKTFGWDRHPSQEEVARQGLANTDWLWKQVYLDGFRENRWDRLEMVEMKFNRLILFPSPLYHSRYPKEWPDSDRPRYIKTFFLRGAKGAAA